MNYKISIIIPVYNIEKYIRKCLHSVLNQTYNNIEVIVVIDGTEDKSESIINEFSKDKRMVIIKTANRGLSAARNLGIKIASGEYIGFVDGDDWIEVDMYKELMCGIVKESADMALCNMSFVDESDNAIGKKEYINPYVYNGMIYNLMYNVIHDDNYVCNKLYKKELIKDIHFPEGKYFEDIYIMYKIILKANKIAYINRDCYKYLQRDNSISHRKFDVKKLDLLEAYYDRYLNLKNINAMIEYCCRKAIFECILNMRIDIINNISEIRNSDRIHIIDEVVHLRHLDLQYNQEQLKLLDELSALITGWYFFLSMNSDTLESIWKIDLYNIALKTIENADKLINDALRTAFTELNLNKVYVNVIRDNYPVFDILDRFNFITEAIHRGQYFDGTMHDVVYMTVLKHEWQLGGIRYSFKYEKYAIETEK